jgi:hypothetical protein
MADMGVPVLSGGCGQQGLGCRVLPSTPCCARIFSTACRLLYAWSVCMTGMVVLSVTGGPWRVPGVCRFVDAVPEQCTRCWLWIWVGSVFCFGLDCRCRTQALCEVMVGVCRSCWHQCVHAADFGAMATCEAGLTHVVAGIGCGRGPWWQVLSVVVVPWTSVELTVVKCIGAACWCDSRQHRCGLMLHGWSSRLTRDRLTCGQHQ